MLRFLLFFCFGFGYVLVFEDVTGLNSFCGFLLLVNKFVTGLVDESFDGSDGFECYSFEIVAAFLA